MYPKRAFIPVGAACLLALAGAAAAAPVYWTDWTQAAPGDPDAVVGTIAGAGPGAVKVTYAGDYFFAVLDNDGVNYWSPQSTYADGSMVDHGPALKDIIGLRGGGATVHALTFSQPVVNPVMGIVSLGRPSVLVTYDFDASFDIITNGPGYFGNGPLNELPGDVLEGREGHGTILFEGTFSEIRWTIPTTENWHGFTLGICGAGAAPSPDATPAPGALLLGSLGTVLIGCLRRRGVL